MAPGVWTLKKKNSFLIFCFVGDLVGCELCEMDQKEKKEKRKRFISSSLDDCVVWNSGWEPVPISIFLSSNEIPEKRSPSQLTPIVERTPQKCIFFSPKSKFLSILETENQTKVLIFLFQLVL